MTDHRLDKYSLLEKVLAESGFFEVLETRWRQSGKSRPDFQIAIKPSITMLLRRSDVGVYTDPFLVIHLLRLILQRGYPNLMVVESQNLYGNWFQNRSVLQIAARAGYLDETRFADLGSTRQAEIHVRGGGVDAKVPLVDMTLDTALCDLGAGIGKIPVGRAWVEADFRVGFAKMKTHFYSDYSLAIKNIYGCLPLQDKVRAYHCRRVVGKWTAHLIEKFPVHFSIVDGYTAADGWLGVKIKAIARKPHTIMAGEDILALDCWGASLIGVNAEKTIMFKNLAPLITRRPAQRVGNAEPAKPWRKSPHFLALFCRLIEANAYIMDFSGALATGGYDDCFPHKKSADSILKRILYILSLPVNWLSDIGCLRLRLRERIFFRKLIRQQERIPLIAGSEYLHSRLTILAPEDLSELDSILREGIDGQISFSGHYLFIGARELALPARLSPANLAIAEILNHVRQNRVDAKALADELQVVLDLYRREFRGNGLYSFCYE